MQKRRMRVYVTGRPNGYLVQRFLRRGFFLLESDILNEEAFAKELAQKKPDRVLHLAGKSNPDWCELHKDEAVRVNFRGTTNVVRTCVGQKTPVVVLSSAQIWGGGWWESLRNKHSEDSRFTPARNYYGQTKIAAEMAVDVCETMYAKVIRSSYIFDRARCAKELANLKAGIPVDAPTFLKRSFIHVEDFITQVDDYCKRFYLMPDILHLAGNLTVSYCEFWTEVCRQFGFDQKLVRARRHEINHPPERARRPHYAGLDVSLSKRLGFWQSNYIHGIKRMLHEEG